MGSLWVRYHCPGIVMASRAHPRFPPLDWLEFTRSSIGRPALCLGSQPVRDLEGQRPSLAAARHPRRTIHKGCVTRGRDEGLSGLGAVRLAYSYSGQASLVGSLEDGALPSFTSMDSLAFDLGLLEQPFSSGSSSIELPHLGLSPALQVALDLVRRQYRPLLV